MLQDITLGQYYPGNSILHRLDPRTKFLGTIAFIVGLFFVQHFWGYAFVTCVLVALICLSKVPIKVILKSLKPIFVILIITMLFNILLVPGVVIAQWWIFRITKEGIFMAIRMGIRLVYLVTGSSLMTLTTTPTAMTDAMERLFKPLAVIRVPVHEIAMMMSIALRFIPILMEETEKIKKAQMARGADFETGNLVRRVKSLVPILVPLFVSAFQRANDLALAMEARCYHGGAGRTQMKPLHYERRDAIAYIIIVLFLAACTVCLIYQI